MVRLLVLRFPAIVLFLSAFVSCAPLAPGPPETRPHGPSGARRRAVLISFDGVSGERLARLLEDPAKLPAGGYRRIAERGLHAVYSVPPTPSLTAVAHITHVTGALPEKTGIVSNSMLDWSKPFGTTLSGFDAPIRVETLWEAARRQGKRTGVVLYPGADGKTPQRSADFAMVWPGPPLARGKIHLIEAGSWNSMEADLSGSFSPGRRVSLSFGKTSHIVSLLALDTTDDGQKNYDRLRVEPEAGAVSDIRAGDWFPVEVKAPGGRTGAWCKLVALAPNLSTTEVYLGGLYANAGYPEEFLRTVNERVGFWPGPPDDSAFGSRSARPEVFLEQAERIAEFITRAQLLALARSDWDLLLMYQPQVDEVSHEFFLTDPGQPGYSAARAAQFEKYVEAAYALADRSLDAIEKALSPGDSIFVTSDHGMTPIWSEVYPNEILRRAGLLALDRQRQIAPSSDAVAVTSSGIAHVYVNRSRPPEVLERIQSLFRSFLVRGESPWEEIVRRQDAGRLSLRSPNSGILILLCKPGYVASGRVPEGGEADGIPGDFGSHGYRNTYPQLHASFLAAGPEIRHERVEQINSWQIAARVARAIGIKPPRDAARP